MALCYLVFHPCIGRKDIYSAPDVWSHLTTRVFKGQTLVLVPTVGPSVNLYSDKSFVTMRFSYAIFLDNSSDAIKKVRPALAGGKNRGVKSGSNFKADKTHKDWSLACEAYRKLASQDVKMKRSSFLNSSHCAACFTGTKSEEHYFGRFLV